MFDLNLLNLLELDDYGSDLFLRYCVTSFAAGQCPADFTFDFPVGMLRCTRCQPGDTGMAARFEEYDDLLGNLSDEPVENEGFSDSD